MRVNVYGEELTDRIELVTKEVVDPDGETHQFYGIRFFLRFPGQNWWVHRKTESGELDDDSSAVTFWSADKEQLYHIFYEAQNLIPEEVVEL